MKDINDVKNFWENSPLFVGESTAEVGSKEFFEEHSSIYLNDCFSGNFDEKCFPCDIQNKEVLDLGCGPGFWIERMSKKNPSKIFGCDLTKRALELASKRCKFLSIDNVEFVQANAEKLPFDDNVFDFINCQGVIHHTPNTNMALAEIKRCLKPGGSFSISVYYENIFLRSWTIIRPIGRFLTLFGAGLKGRGRENIFSLKNKADIVRIYDGINNPIGKSYSKKLIIKLLEDSNLKVKNTFLHFFPARALPLSISKSFHKFLDKRFGFMIYLTGIKKVD
tara:strand:+ start:2060 stop:2896 length:837 start_codon:yes stop_codon:yes gene_type:complete